MNVLFGILLIFIAFILLFVVYHGMEYYENLISVLKKIKSENDAIGNVLSGNILDSKRGIERSFSSFRSEQYGLINDLKSQFNQIQSQLNEIKVNQSVISDKIIRDNTFNVKQLSTQCDTLDGQIRKVVNSMDKMQISANKTVEDGNQVIEQVREMSVHTVASVEVFRLNSSLMIELLKVGLMNDLMKDVNKNRSK